MDLLEKIGGKTKREYNHEEHDEELRALINKETFDKVYKTALLGNPNKSERSEAFKAIREEFKTRFTEEELEMTEEEVDKMLLEDYGSEEEVEKALEAFRDGI